MQRWRETDSPDLGFPPSGSSILVCVQLHLTCAQTKPLKSLSLEQPHPVAFLTYYTLIYRFCGQNIAKLKTALVCLPDCAEIPAVVPQTPAAFALSSSPTSPCSAVPMGCLLFKCMMGTFHKLPSFILEVKFWVSSYPLEWSPYVC